MRDHARDIVCDLFGEEPTDEDLDAIALALGRAPAGAKEADGGPGVEVPPGPPVTVH